MVSPWFSRPFARLRSQFSSWLQSASSSPRSQNGPCLVRKSPFSCKALGLSCIRLQVMYIYIWIYIYIHIYIYITCSLIHDKPRALQLKGLFRTRQGPFCDLGELEADCSHEENWLRKRANGRENHGETIDNEVGRYWEDHGMIWIWDTSNHQSNLAGKIENCHL